MKTYPVNECFTSLQGEGYHTGRAAAFVRFAGCNLQCPFCDTDHRAATPMTASEIVDFCRAAQTGFVVLTGGEPGLSVDADLVQALHGAGLYLAVETNGTRPLPAAIDWITLSPKAAFVARGAEPVLTRCNELKVLFTSAEAFPLYEGIEAAHRFVQPLDTGCAEKNSAIMQQAVQFCLEHPAWRLSLQTHKWIGIR